MKIVFMGTPDFARGVLEALVKSQEHEITAVVTQPDKPKGRSKTPVACPVKEYALSCGIPVLSPDRIRNEEEIAKLKHYEADIYVVAAFGQILPKEVLSIPRFGCINVHASLLPHLRGAAPIQWAIALGDKITGVTIMQMDEGLDTGDIITQSEVAISKEETGESLFDKLMLEGAKLLLATLPDIEAGNAAKTPQDEAASSYAKMIRKDDGFIDFELSAESIDCRVRAFTPWPGGYTYLNGKMLKIKKCRVVSDSDIAGCAENAETTGAGCDNKITPGTVVAVTKDEIFVKCGESILAIYELQAEGKRIMSVHDFLLGKPIKPGLRLGV